MSQMNDIQRRVAHRNSLYYQERVAKFNKAQAKPNQSINKHMIAPVVFFALAVAAACDYYIAINRQAQAAPIVAKSEIAKPLPIAMAKGEKRK